MKLLRFLLFPFAVLYDIITSIRNWCFDVNILKSTSFDVPVIAVGNLSVGGTGKTPQIEYLIRLLKNEYKVGVLSRGYKRKTNGFIQLNESHSVEDVGDEPLQFFKKFEDDIIVAVDADRTNGIKQLLKNENSPDVILLDDAYQHRKVKAKTYILLTKYNDLYTDDFIFPTGNLRESKRGANRADIVVVTKCPQKITEEEQKQIQRKIKLKKHQKLFFSCIEYDDELKGNSSLSIEDLRRKEVVLITGIANPKPLLEYLSEKKINYRHLSFPDHHNFLVSDINNINQVFNSLSTKNKVMLTTEKDYTRLCGKLDNLFYINIKTFFLTKPEVFDKKIKLLIK